MSKINLLDSSVYNRIAAGEVVDKPASVVKELVENAVDSGATSVSVSISDGGKTVRVTDNGCGIGYDDVRTAFLPHATSKIKEIEDLNAIRTLGFRGEALPSIASVAKVTMLTKTTDSDLGTKLVIENGKEVSFGQTGAPQGTTVTVEDLFKNVPARLKFLRSDRSEEGDITSLVQKIILANHHLAFTYTVNGKEVYRSSGSGLKDAIYATHGMNFLNETEYINATMSGIELYGYINKPAFSKHNRSYQTLIVNGRYVLNSDISFWIYNCFSEFLMKRQYPAYVLFLNLPNDMVDINVHPNKMEVKFVDFTTVRRLLSQAISESLNKSTHEPKTIELNPDLNRVRQSDSVFVPAEGKPSDNSVADFAVFPSKAKTDEKSESKDVLYPDVRIVGESKLNDAAATDTESIRPPQILFETPKARQYELFHDIVSENSNVQREAPLRTSDCLYRGKLFNTYLLLEKCDEVIIIDQHAAHEKILYEQFVEVVENGADSVQNLLIPYIFDVDTQEEALIDGNIDDITALGFTINKLSGNSYSVSALPLILSSVKMSDLVSALIDSLRRSRFGKKAFLKEELMQSACKAAVKGEEDLGEREIRKLLREIDEHRIELFCPHGRPIAVKIKRTEIEKWFKRIV